MIAGDDDHVSPSARLAQMAQARAEQRDGPTVEVVIQPGAGHHLSWRRHHNRATGSRRPGDVPGRNPGDQRPGTSGQLAPRGLIPPIFGFGPSTRIVT